MRSQTVVRRRRRAAAASKEITVERYRRSEPVWWAWLDLNQRPHPYQENAGNRCAEHHSRRSHSTVEAEVMCCHRSRRRAAWHISRARRGGAGVRGRLDPHGAPRPAVSSPAGRSSRNSRIGCVPSSSLLASARRTFIGNGAS